MNNCPDIAFIDDDAALRRSLRRTFERAGFKTALYDPTPHFPSLHPAFKGQVAPRIIVSDFSMGLLTALDTVEAVRATPGWEETKIVVLTGGSLFKTHERFFKENGITVLSKKEIDGAVETLKAMLREPSPTAPA